MRKLLLTFTFLACVTGMQAQSQKLVSKLTKHLEPQNGEWELVKSDADANVLIDIEVLRFVIDGIDMKVIGIPVPEEGITSYNCKTTYGQNYLVQMVTNSNGLVDIFVYKTLEAGSDFYSSLDVYMEIQHRE